MRLGMWDEMMALERRVDDLFREILAPRARPRFPALPKGLHALFVPSADVYARNGDFVVRMELPGIDPDADVKLTIEDGALVVRGERKHTEEVKEDDYYRMETSYGAFERHMPVPEGTTDKDVKASYGDGILEIVVPKAAKKHARRAEKPKAIKIGKTKAA